VLANSTKSMNHYKIQQAGNSAKSNMAICTTELNKKLSAAKSINKQKSLLNR
jgi:hypothetical protein